MFKIAVLSSSNGTIFQSLIDAQAKGRLSNVEICCLITDKPHCGSVTKAEVANIPVHILEPDDKSRETFDWEVMDVLNKYEVDLVVLAGYFRIVGLEMVERYRNKIINVHPSLLPKYSGKTGATIHREVLEAGDKEAGISVHFVDEGLDTGGIIMQKKVEVAEGETVDSMKQKVQGLEVEWTPRVVQMFADGEIGV